MTIQPNQMSVRELLEMLFQNKWPFLLCTLAGFCVAWFALEKMDKWYQSEATIQIVDRMTNDPMTKGLGVATPLSQRFQEVSAKVLSNPSMTKMAKDLKLVRADAREEVLMAAVNGIKSSLSIRYSDGGQVVVHCERKNSCDEAQSIVKWVVKSVQAENTLVREAQIRQAMDLLSGLLTQYKNKLDDAEKVLKNFVEMNQLDLTQDPREMMENIKGITNTDGARGMISQLLELVTRQTDNDLKLTALVAKRQQIQGQIAKEPAFKTSQMLTAQSEVTQQLERKRADAITALTGLRNTMSENHPLVQAKMNELKHYDDELRKSSAPVTLNETKSVNPVHEQLNLQLSTLETEIAALKSEQESLKKQTAQMTERTRGIPDKELQKDQLMREKTIYTRTYETLRNKYEDALLTNKLEGADREARFDIINEPSRDNVAIRPSKKFVLAMGTFIGVVIGIALSFVREFTDTSFRNLDDASRYLDLPVMGVIPEVIGISRQRRLRGRRM